MGKGGRGATNVPKLKGATAQGSRPAGSSAIIPNGQYPTVLGTKKLSNIPGVITGPDNAAINEPGETTVNSTPA